jgi:hypothetical protein
VLAPLSRFDASAVSLDADFSMDHAPFLAVGIPVFTLWVDEGEYDVHHDAVSDTFDKVDPRMLALDTDHDGDRDVSAGRRPRDTGTTFVGDRGLGTAEPPRARGASSCGVRVH